jgi:O-6-methylguanine DNA methyltransferase
MTPFTRKIYKVVLSIPLGEIRTYKWVAKKAGRPRAYRAVGQVLKNNPYPLIIPCHRVVKCNNILGGYIWGKRAKRVLLDLERQIRKSML